MKSLIRSSAAVAVLAAGLTFAQQAKAFEFSAVGGLNITAASIEEAGVSATAISGKSTVAFGGLAAFGVMPGFDLETGLVYVPRKFGATFPIIGEFETQFSSWMIPLALRFNALPFVSVAAGPYFMMATGNVSTTVLGVTAESAFDAAGISSSEFGLHGSVRVGFPIVPTIRVFADARYLMGLSNRATDAADSTKFNDVQVLGGLSFGL